MNFLKQTKLWFILIIIYPWLYIFQGFDVTDSGFSLSLYSSAFIDGISHDYPRYFTTLIGGLWHKYFGFIGYIGFKIIYIFLLYMIMFMVWHLTKKFDKKNILPFAIFLTLIFITKSGGNWINYNILSSLFYIYIIYFLYTGIIYSNSIFILISGFIAGINIFIRLPNILDILFGLIFVYTYYLYKKNFYKEFFYFIGGYSLGIVFGLFILINLGVYEQYIDSIVNLFAVFMNNTTSNYSHTSLLQLLIKDYTYIVLTTLFIFISITILKNFKSLFTDKKIVYLLSLLIAITSLNFLNIICIWKYIYLGLFYSGILIILIESKDIKLKILSVLSLMFVGLIPLGSDNGVYNSIYGMWLIMPIVILYFANQKYLQVKRYTIINENLFNFLKTTFILSTLLFSLHLKFHSTYRDSNNRLSLCYGIDNNKLSYTYTTKNRAKVVNEFIDKLKKYTHNRELFLYDKIAIFYYILNKPVPLSHPWAVNKLQNDEFQKEFLKYAIKNLPIIANPKYSVSNTVWPQVKEPLPHMYYKNRDTIKNFMTKFNYHKVWENDFFEIWDNQ